MSDGSLIDLTEPEVCALCLAPAAGYDDLGVWCALHLAEREFVAASVEVWREIDRLTAGPEGYKGLDGSVAIRVVERAAWACYRDVLDSTPNAPPTARDSGPRERHPEEPS